MDFGSEDHTGTSCLNKQIRIRRWIQILLIGATVISTQFVRAQIPHGGWPLEQGSRALQTAKKSSVLSSSVDYFVEMPAFNVDSVLSIDSLPGNRAGGLKFAHKFFVNLSPENSGVVFHTEDGTTVWRVGIRSKGAYSLNVLFGDFDLPDGAKVFLYNSDRSTVLGGFTNENNPEGGEFSVSPVDGEELTIEYQEPANVPFTGKIRITEVNHDYRGLFRAGTRFNLTDLPCIPDLSCDSTYDTIGRSVCLLIINGDTYCTGTFINNTANDGTPYLLTASHCFGGSTNDNNLTERTELGKRVVAFMNYVSPRCDKRLRGSEEFSLSGSTTKAISKEIDFALLELTEKPPSDYRPYLAGWSLDTITNNALPFTCIHHPFGEMKKYCVEKDSLTLKSWGVVYGFGANNHWNIRKWDVGHTWAGSSGSPLFDKYNRLRGGLSGGDSDCNDYATGDFYFRLDKAWNHFSNTSMQLKHWLDPMTPDSVQSPINLDGLDPYENNPSICINNLMPSDSMGVTMLDSPQWGSFFGHSSIGTSHFAEHFTTADSSMIQGVFLVAAKGHNNSQLPVTVRVYGGGNTPGRILGKALLNPNYLEYVNGAFIKKTKNYFSNRKNYIRFNTPISVGKDFYVGYEISYPIKAVEDTFYLYSAIRENVRANTAYFMKNELWYPYPEHPFSPVYTSLWIEPVIANDTITLPNNYYYEDKDSIIKKRPVIAYSTQESLIKIALPDQWAGITDVEIFDYTGRNILKTKVSPPIGTIYFPSNKNRILIIRLRNEKLVYVLKLMIGK
ncbi:MAG: serine protease [Bacteroidales bacterium]|nr:serine protease [Bacteroidales bacterium]